MIPCRIEAEAVLSIISAGLTIDPVLNRIGFECLHDTVFIPYRIHKGIEIVPFS